MDKGEILFSRRSIRKYKKEGQINDEQIRYMLNAAMSAPTAMNRQPWQFVVIRNTEKLKELSQVFPYGKMLADAAVGILVCGDSRVDELESNLVQAGSAATQNLLLAAHAIGLGAVWLGVHGREERMKKLKELFKLPLEVVPISMISIGVPDEEKPRNDNYNPERVHNEQW